MTTKFASYFLFAAVLLAQGIPNQAFAQKEPAPLLEAQETSPDFLPKEERFQFRGGKNPNVLSKSLLRQFLGSQRIFETMIDPNRGIWIVTYVTADDSEDGLKYSSHQLCQKTLKQKLPSLLKEGRKILKSSDADNVTRCQNNVALPFCSISIIGEYGIGWDFIFTRNANKDLVFWGILVRNSTYRQEFQKKENAALKKTFETSQLTLCP